MRRPCCIVGRAQKFDGCREKRWNEGEEERGSLEDDEASKKQETFEQVADYNENMALEYWELFKKKITVVAEVKMRGLS